MTTGRPGVRPGPRVSWVPLKAYTNDAEDAIFLASGYGLIPDDWQNAILFGWLARRRNGKWCSGKCGVAAPRQNGKNGVIEVRELYGMVALGEAFLHTAHEVKTCRKAFKRLKHFFGEERNDPKAKFPELNALVKEVRSTNGQEAIFLKDVWDVDGTTVYAVGRPSRSAKFVRAGGSIEFVARSKGSGRGFTVDVLVLDEAQHLTDDELEAIRSAVSSAPLGDPQVIYAGTPPNRDKGELGEVFIRIRSGVGKDKRLCWTEYGAPDGPLPDLDDDELLYAANPALELRHANGAYGLTRDVVRDERGDLSDEGYARERLGWWGNPHRKQIELFGTGRWAACEVTVTDPPPVRAIGVAVTVDKEWASIAAAGTWSDGSPHIGAVDRREGSGWVYERALAIRADHDCVIVVDEKCPDATLVRALREAGAVVIGAEQWIQACSDLESRVKTVGVTHMAHPELDDAVASAGWRYIGDRRVIGRKTGDADMLEAAALALHKVLHPVEVWGFTS